MEVGLLSLLTRQNHAFIFMKCCTCWDLGIGPNAYLERFVRFTELRDHAAENMTAVRLAAIMKMIKDNLGI